MLSAYTKSGTTDKEGKTITPREQKRNEANLLSLLKSPKNRSIVGITEEGYLVEVDDQNQATISGSSKKVTIDYTLLIKDILGKK